MNVCFDIILMRGSQLNIIKRQLVVKICLLLLLMPFVSSSQTTIIVVRTSYCIYVGADTRKGTTVYDQKTNQRISTQNDTACKIFRNRNIYYSVAGANPEIVYGQIRKSIDSKRTFEASLKDIIKNVKLQRQAYLSDLQRSNKAIFESRYKELQSLEVALFGYENSIPKTVRVVFFIITTKDRPVLIKDTIPNKDFGKPSFKNEFIPFPMGHAEEIKTKMFTRDFWLGKHPLKAIEELILIEAKAHPESVAKPIDLLTIDKNGAHWFGEPAKCKLN